MKKKAGVGSILAVSILGCSSPIPVGGAEGAGGSVGGTPIIDLGGAGGLATGAQAGSTASGAPTDDANCGTSTSNLSQQPADLLLIVDRSESMGWSMTRDEQECAANDPTCQQRWATMTKALDQILVSSPSGVRWGLKLFATPATAGGSEDEENCTVIQSMEVPVSGGAIADMQVAIKETGPGGYTPTMLAIRYATKYLQGLTDPYQRYILLATDGEPNCDGSSAGVSAAPQVNHVVAEIEAAAAAGIKVYVIGVGPRASIRSLDKFAEAGGTDQYYPATSAAELTASLASIVGQVANCTYELTAVPPDPANIGVYLDKQIVPRDGSNGWTLGPGGKTVVFVGSACDGIKSGKYKQVQVFFGCAGVKPPDLIP